MGYAEILKIFAIYTGFSCIRYWRQNKGQAKSNYVILSPRKYVYESDTMIWFSEQG